jgi:hypothetical protein
MPIIPIQGPSCCKAASYLRAPKRTRGSILAHYGVAAGKKQQVDESDSDAEADGRGEKAAELHPQVAGKPADSMTKECSHRPKVVQYLNCRRAVAGGKAWAR